MTPPVILDTHVHLWPSSSTTSSAHGWMQPGHFLSKRHGPLDYLSITDASVKGIVYIETDRHLPPLPAALSSPTRADASTCQEVEDVLKQWAHEPLEEIKFLRRIAEGTTEDGDGDVPGKGASLMKACVLYAPMHLPNSVFEAYLRVAEKVAGPTLWGQKVVGFRFLLQGKKQGEVTRLVGRQDWIDNLLSLGKGPRPNGKGWTFDVGVDLHRDGDEGLIAVGGMIEQVRKRGGKGVFVLDHLCKPPLSNAPPSKTFSTALKALQNDQNVYMKLSGALNEFDKTPDSVEQVAAALKGHVDVVFGCFQHRVMFGSDWPVCNVGGPKGESGNWLFWREVVQRVVEERGMSEGEREGVWWAVGARAYGVAM
ncbi:hypothetical protein ACEQ8H_008386 [Pleosporales sp. CAS-2024a]